MIYFSKKLFSILLVILLVGMLSLPGGYAAEITGNDGVLTCDLSDNPRTNFNPGDDIRYKVNFSIESFLELVVLGGTVKGPGFQEESLIWQFGLLPAGNYITRWDSKIPSDAHGEATVNILYSALMNEPAAKANTFTIGEEPPDDATEVGSEVCMACHSAVYDSLKDSPHGFIECEACHGPGSAHASAPSPDTITVNRSSSLCGQCHSRGDDQNRIEVVDGLLRSYQQYDELLGGNKFFLECVECHEPHISLDSDTQDGLTADCTSCHTKTINRVHARAGVECIDCHMPFAAKKKTSSGEGSHLEGDVRTHIFTPNTTAYPFEMYYQQSDKTFANGFLTVNFLCLGCHDGSFGREQEIDWAMQAVGLIHSD
jgi:hypothetical protein